MSSDADRVALLTLAREAIAAHVLKRAAPHVPASGAAAMPGGAFVTLHRFGQLRGCIGQIEADRTVGQVIARCAVAAATTDPRFPPVSPSELPELRIELSLLGPLEPIAGPADIEIGRHGLVVEMGSHRGLLLPQVATEWALDAAGFLAQTCDKADVPRDAWKHGASLWRFSAEVFGEQG